MRKIEVCCGSVADVMAARQGGAARVELCSALEVGGVTPSAGLIAGAIREKGELRINVLIRPRGGDFVYSLPEVSQMEADIAAAKIAGADGVVIGALTPEGNLDIPVIQRLLRQAEGMDVTFHRAFDEVRAPLQALETLISLGIPRLLTSGQAPTAAEGAQLIAQLVRAAAGRISVMPGAGINPANIAAIEKATGAGEFHSTARSASLLSGSKYDRLPQEESALFGSRPRPTSRAVVAALVNG